MPAWTKITEQGWPIWGLLLAAGWAVSIFLHALIATKTVTTPLYVAILDPFTHGLTALLVVWPLFLDGSPFPIRLLVWASLAGVFIDIDHAIAAQSVKAADMMGLGERPVTHSLFFTTLLSFGGALLIARGWGNSGYLLGSWYILSIALASHVLRDACGGATPWAFPFDSPTISSFGFFGVFVVVSALHLSLTYQFLTQNESIAECLAPFPSSPYSAVHASPNWQFAPLFAGSLNRAYGVFTNLREGQDITAVYTGRFMALPHEVFPEVTAAEAIVRGEEDASDEKNANVNTQAADARVRKYLQLLRKRESARRDARLHEELEHARLMAGTWFWHIYNGLTALERFHLMAAQFASTPYCWWIVHFSHAAQVYARRVELLEQYKPVVESHYHITEALSNREGTEGTGENSLGRIKRSLQDFSARYEAVESICDLVLLQLRRQSVSDVSEWWKERATKAAKTILDDLDLLFRIHPYGGNEESDGSSRLPIDDFVKQIQEAEEFRKRGQLSPIESFFKNTPLCTLWFHRYAIKSAPLLPTLCAAAVGTLTRIDAALMTLKNNPYKGANIKNYLRQNYSSEIHNEKDKLDQIIPPVRIYLNTSENSKRIRELSIDPQAMTKIDREEGHTGHPGLENVLPGMHRFSDRDEGYRVDQYLIRIWYYHEQNRNQYKQENTGDYLMFKNMRDFVVRWSQPGRSGIQREQFIRESVKPISKKIKETIFQEGDSDENSDSKSLAEAFTSHLQGNDEPEAIKQLWQLHRHFAVRASKDPRLHTYFSAWYIHGM